MARTPAPTAWLALPAVAGHSALRAGLMAMSVPSTVMPTDRRERGRQLARLTESPATVAFIDITPGGADHTPTLAELDALVPPGPVRARVHLTRLAGGHVSEADRHWVRSLGFADLVPEFDAQDCEGQLRTTLDAVAAALSAPALPAVELARYARVMNADPGRTSPRAVIRSLTGLSAEGLATLLSRSLAIEDRSYRLQTYPRCFVGADAVAWMGRHLHRSAAEAVALGHALGTLGLLVHVTHDHPFLDDQLFYRLAWSEGTDGPALGAVFEALRGPDGVHAATRNHLGRSYEDCWIGAEAVAWMAERYTLSRLDAWLARHRLMQFGLVEHVEQARPFIDGDYYYRFRLPPAAERS
jgi:Domain found in Dishevelled, Egl-10, and Pleckstrin (DEP)